MNVYILVYLILKFVMLMLFYGISKIDRIEVDDCPTMLLGLGAGKGGGDTMGMRIDAIHGVGVIPVGLCEA